ncbi:guanylate kinase [Paenibacillus puerhi]|uniref:guanylate kinase n=1 Tax=Paenibacillus puerhi TaxID=2692622 RepID=UPI00135C6834|nr:guanylate kinase [Paenibacillus puerhi]
MNGRPILLLFTGTGGSGRKSVARRVGEALQLTAVASYTTREPRKKETNTDFYRFIHESDFEKAEQDGEFIQTAKINRYRYGIKRADLEAALSSEYGAYLVLNKEGTELFKRMFGAQAVRIFIYVSKQSILERLTARGTPFEVLERYMAQYPDEVSYRKSCEIVVENLELEATAAKVLEAVRASLLVT